MKLKIWSLAIGLWFLPLVAGADWEYPGYYIGEGVYQDDGSRFTLSLRGGIAISNGSIKNELGSLVSAPYFYDPSGIIVSEAYCVAIGDCDPVTKAPTVQGYVSAGQIDIAELPAKKKFGSYSFAAGAGIGWTLPYSPQWRIEANWDHISESGYNSAPMFDGTIESTVGKMLHILSGGVQSKSTTDVVSAVFYYDFFDGLQKSTKEFVPYIGFGAGYASNNTILNLTDLYGDLSGELSLADFSDSSSVGLEFYESKTTSSNIAGILAAGFSYGLEDGLFLDMGLRLMYLPKIKWELNTELNPNITSFRSREVFSANNIIYTTISIGVRFEF